MAVNLRMMRKIALLTACVLLALTVAGCANTNSGGNDNVSESASGTEESKEVKTVSILVFSDWGTMPGPDDEQIKYVTEKTGISIQSETLPWNGGTDFTKGLNAKIAANELPDLF